VPSSTPFVFKRANRMDFSVVLAVKPPSQGANIPALEAPSSPHSR
jgi:hypothetical protein